MYMRKHHKEIVQSRGVASDGKIPLPLMTKGERFIRCKGLIRCRGKRQRTKAWFQGERFIRCRGQRHGSRGSRFIRYIGQRHGSRGSKFIRCRGQRHGSRGSIFIRCRGQRHGSRGSMINMMMSEVHLYISSSW